ncbi:MULTISPECIES: MFS transporter [Phenylobacterium]|uniref:MFS family permease n=1 Tax=Phenylobacterium koreense TaxID=266125 RepID=A0ABV2EJT0_9CAUL
MSGEPTHSRARQATITLVLGLGQTVAFASSYYLMGVMADPLAADLGLSPAVVFGLMSGALAISPLLSPATGRWIDARGGKPVLLASNLVFALALGLLAASPNLIVLCLAMLALGIGMTIGMYGTPFAILVSLYGEGARRPITAVALLGGLGSALGWPLTGHLIETYGWRGACLAWALVHLAVCFPIVALVTPRPAPRPAQGKSPHGAVAWDRRMVQLAILFACAWFISSAMANHLPRLLAAIGLPVAKAAAVAGLVGVAAVSVRFAEFTVLRKAPPLISTRIATLMHPLGATAVAVLGPGAASLLALGQGAGNGMLTVAKGVLPLSLYGPENYAYRSALLSQPAQVLQIGGPALYALALAESPKVALTLSSGLCLVMFAMTFGLQAASQSKKEQAAA